MWVRRRLESSARNAQASVELVAVLPAMAVCLVIAAQTVVVGWALWSAGNAARAGARADEVGADAESAARRALPAPLRGDAEIRAGDGVRVKVRVPALIPGTSLPRVTAASTLDGDAAR
jgi:hypothetical protein